MTRWYWLTLSLFGASVAHAQGTTADADRLVAALDSNWMRLHLAALAHDSMEGRGPGTPGGRRAGDYIAHQFKMMGLTPAGDSGTYFRDFQFQIVRNLSSTMRIGTDSLLYGIEQHVTTDLSGEQASFRGEAVFAGYGLSSARWDDYKGKDLEGKIVIVLAGMPPGVDPSVLPEGAGTRGYKTRIASQHGARTTLVIHRQDLTGFDWREIQQYWNEEHVIRNAPGSVVMHNRPVASGWISAAAGERLLQAGGYSLDQAIQMSNTGGTGPIGLGMVIDGKLSNQIRTVHGRNVVGRLEGSGPAAGEFVVIGGHYDAYGIGPAVKGDSIYNGAEDNAAGTAQVLALAEAFARSGARRNRSMLFVAFDAEEPGLLGAEAFVARPPVPMASQVAMINLDAANLYGATRDVAALGLKESTLDGSFRRAAQAEGMVVPAAQPDSIEAFFLRSDQLPFARAGIPATFVFVGWDFVGRTPAWASRMWSNYFEQHYHQPSDEMQDYFSMAGALQQARVVARMALEIANTTERPAWSAGSRFRRE